MFSPPPLKFRTAGFPQYGFKRKFNRDLRTTVRVKCGRIPPAMALIRGQKPSTEPAAHRREPWGSRDLLQAGQRSGQHQAIPSRGPWLASGLCCPARSMLTMTSSEPLPSTRQLMDSLSSLQPRLRREREGPQFNRRVCSCVPSPGPRWTGRLQLAVASPTVLAFANFAVARHPHCTTHVGSCVDRVTRRTGSLALRPARLLALHQQGRLRSSFRRTGRPDQRRL